jgi:hypothetical protein
MEDFKELFDHITDNDFGKVINKKFDGCFIDLIDLRKL